MSGISLNLASRPFRNNTIVATVLLVATLALVGATFYNVHLYLNYGGRYEALQQEEQRHRDRLAALETEERSGLKEIQTRNFTRLKGRGDFAADLILRRAFSWTLLFNKLEDVVPAEVMMTAIRPHITGAATVIRVDGIAKNHGALIGLEDALLKNPSFARVYPVSERRLNPSRPEISFALNFDYLPAKAPSGPDAIASAATPTPSESPAPSPVPSAPAPAVVASNGPATRSAVSRSVSLSETVGRDGRQRTPEVLARVTSAPGGFYPDAPPTAVEAPEKKPKGKRHGSKSTVAPVSPAAAPKGGSAPLPSGTHETQTAPAPTLAAASSSNAVTRQDGQPGAVSSRPAGLTGRRGMGARKEKQARPLPAGQSEPVPATRLDVPLKFHASPVGDIYAALSRAHGVRFELDPTIDQRTQVTADLAGRSLGDAIAVLSRLAGHRVQRIDAGRYRVVPTAGGEPLADQPVQEESLPGQEVRP